MFESRSRSSGVAFDNSDIATTFPFAEVPTSAPLSLLRSATSSLPRDAVREIAFRPNAMNAPLQFVFGFPSRSSSASIGGAPPLLWWRGMEDKKTRDEKFEKFTWTIKDLSKLKTKKIYSENFFIGGHPWRILVFPKGNHVDYLSVYLDVRDADNLPHGWSRSANFKIVLINQVNGKMSITKETTHIFNARENDWGFTSFIPLAEFNDPCKGFVLNDTCIIEVRISVTNSELESKVDQSASSVSAQVPVKTSEYTDTPLPMETSTDTIDELTDFRGLGKIEKAFVPLLEEVCLRHPSIIECQQKRSRRFTEWAFTALGRVLHFLKTKKVKDMNDEACNYLQILWEELETFRFDLSWLEPHVQSALGMKSYMERAVQVKSMKENVASIEMEIKRLKAKMAATEVDLEIARRELVKAEAGFEERDLDAELGYGP